MSVASDKFERDIADAINSIPGTKAERPKVGTDYSDVHITRHNNNPVNAWLEVKMSHTDNLSNPRVFYKDGFWQTSYKTPAAGAAIKLLNESSDSHKFLMDIAKFSGIPFRSIKIPTNRGALSEEGAVPLHVMKSYFNQPGINRYIMSKDNFNLGKVVTDHYTLGKSAPAYYMQAGDDFYLISSTNPLKLPYDIPLLSGTGEFRVRISTRSEFYEVQAEIKIKNMPNSSYSAMLGTSKKNPFTTKK